MIFEAKNFDQITQEKCISEQLLKVAKSEQKVARRKGKIKVARDPQK
jgi:hypothetical protein